MGLSALVLHTAQHRDELLALLVGELGRCIHDGIDEAVESLRGRAACGREVGIEIVLANAIGGAETVE